MKELNEKAMVVVLEALSDMRFRDAMRLLRALGYDLMITHKRPKKASEVRPSDLLNPDLMAEMKKHLHSRHEE